MNIYHTIKALMNKIKSSKFGFLPLVLLLSSSVPFYYSYHLHTADEILKREGINIPGIITKKKITGSKNENRKYYLYYQFTYNLGEYNNESRVRYQFWTKVKVGDKIPVRIESNNPDNSQVRSPYVFPRADDFLVIAIALVIMGTVFILIPNNRILRNIFMQEKG